MTSVYVAGASAEVDMVAGYIERLVSAGVHVTLDWTVPVRASRAAGNTDRELHPREQARHAYVDLDGVYRAEFFWLVVPNNTSNGCWVELGSALAHRKPVIVSGDHGRSIFAALAQRRFDTHEDALRWFTT